MVEKTSKKVKKEKPIKTKKKIKKALPVKKEEKPLPPKEPEKFFESVGRRKTVVARIRLFTRGDKEFLVNGKPLNEYFPTIELGQIASAPLDKMKCLDKFRLQVRVRGGGSPVRPKLFATELPELLFSLTLISGKD